VQLRLSQTSKNIISFLFSFFLYEIGEQEGEQVLLKVRGEERFGEIERVGRVTPVKARRWWGKG
jgi:hypothetical protein